MGGGSQAFMLNITWAGHFRPGLSLYKVPVHTSEVALVSLLLQIKSKVMYSW